MDLQYFHRIWTIHILNFIYFHTVDCTGNGTRNVPYSVISSTTRKITTHESVLDGPSTNTGLIVGGVMIGLIVFLLIVVIIIKSRKNKWKRKASKTERYKAPESEEFVEPTSRKCSQASRRLSDFDEFEPV